jgi:hypothetical protein
VKTSTQCLHSKNEDKEASDSSFLTGCHFLIVNYGRVRIGTESRLRLYYSRRGAMGLAASYSSSENGSLFDYFSDAKVREFGRGWISFSVRNSPDRL